MSLRDKKYFIKFIWSIQHKIKRYTLFGTLEDDNRKNTGEFIESKSENTPKFIKRHIIRFNKNYLGLPWWLSG